MKRVFLCLLALVIVLNISALSAQRYSPSEAARLIDKEYQESKLSLDQKCLYLIWWYDLEPK